ncbi:MFS transporter [Goodfellowiella coeruleoviolacea]|uniref:MFS transporter, DHA2 family, multidrug resistance protein n=1 Tax=Goodfellowiella coeruleoviolacea TaxID=334858 RepID=A0AAE3GB43_9PSEU|nr:MFS transporter [Goodfellowiella coeruleoviolacea]MCP2165032.1 MFS transporter, DHA2 family, multidrug resistance protein [Goodfellowiella coeruleoviolacea]
MSASPAVRHPWAVLAVLCASLVMGAIDFTVLNLALPDLTADLSLHVDEQLWVVDVYPLTSAALIITAGTLADRVDRKRLWLAGMAVFGAASALAALAWSGPVAIAARVVLGVGHAMILTATVALLRATFPDARQRSTAVGIWTASSSLGAALGPVLGGVLVDHHGWRSVFAINLPVVAVALVAGALLIARQPSGPGRPWDVRSSVLSVAAIAGAVYATNHATTNPLALTALLAVAGLALVVVFVRRQRRLAEPLLDVRLFTNRRFTLAALLIMLSYGSYIGYLYLVAQQLQLAEGRTPSQSGLVLLPLALANAAGAALAPRLAARLGPRATTIASLAAIGVALALFAGFGASGAGPLTALILLGFGAGVIMTLASDDLLSSAPVHRAGEIGAIQETAFALGSGLSLAGLGSLTTLVASSPPTVPSGQSTPDSLGTAFTVASLTMTALTALATAGYAYLTRSRVQVTT